MNEQARSFWDEIDRFTQGAEADGLIRPPKMGTPRESANPAEVREFVTTHRQLIENKAETAAMSLSDVNRRRDSRFYALVGLSFVFLLIVLAIVYVLRNTVQLSTILGAGGGVLASYVSVLTGFILLERITGSNDLEALRLETVGVILPTSMRNAFSRWLASSIIMQKDPRAPMNELPGVGHLQGPLLGHRRRRDLEWRERTTASSPRVGKIPVELHRVPANERVSIRSRPTWELRVVRGSDTPGRMSAKGRIESPIPAFRGAAVNRNLVVAARSGEGPFTI
jgi:hypothetical protein